MTSTLLLRLAGPMQAWGTQSRFSIRDTGLEPSKSGVIGLLCSALGKPRDENHPDNRGKPKLADLAMLRMGVRVNREGTPQRDFHTAGGGQNYGVVKSNGAKGETVVSHRYYLADADFLVGLESDDDDLLRQLNEALAHPCWQLFLGRKSFVPALPIHLSKSAGLRVGSSLEEALQSYDWPANKRGEMVQRLRRVIETSPDEPNASGIYEVRHDWPLSFAERRFTIRYVRTDWIIYPRGVADEFDIVSVPTDSGSA